MAMATTATAIELPTTFKFDGTTSDLAQQLYRRSLAGDAVEKLPYEVMASLPDIIQTRLTENGLRFDQLSGLLQRAVVWDSGFGTNQGKELVKIWTLGGLSMAEIAVKQAEYVGANCTFKSCTQPDGLPWSTSTSCEQEVLVPLAKCLVDKFDGITETKSPMWSTGGTSASIPELEVKIHTWPRGNTVVQMVSVHTAKINTEATGLTCGLNDNSKGVGSAIIPCQSRINIHSEVDASKWKAPQRGAIVTQWLKEYAEKKTYLQATTAPSNATVPTTTVSTTTAPISASKSTAPGTTVLATSAPTTISPSSASEAIVSGTTVLVTTAPTTISPSSASEPTVPGTAVSPTTLPGTTGPATTAPTTISPSFASEPTVPATTLSPSSAAEPKGFNGVLLLPIISAILVACCMLLWWCRRQKREKGQTMEMESNPADYGLLDTQFNQFHRHDIYRTGTNYSRSAPTTNSSTDSNTQHAEPLKEAMTILQGDASLVGKRLIFDTIEFDELVSSGGYGEVWVCQYNDQLVAVKRLLQSKSRFPQHILGFALEIQLSASLHHPNIVNFIGVAWDNQNLDTLSMVLEYLPCGDLQTYLHTQGDLLSWPREKIHMAIGMASAIVYMHARTPVLIHRDLKSRNVLLSNNLETKIIDFGVSTGKRDQTMTAGVGTPFWTAPEVLEGTRYSEKSDIYSFGIMLTELDTCKMPYHDAIHTDGEKQLQFHILNSVITRGLRPRCSLYCPDRVKKVVSLCLEHDPAKRPTAVELLEMLQGKYRTVPGGGTQSRVNSYSLRSSGYYSLTDARPVVS